MTLQELPIKRKIMAVIMLTSITVLLLTALAFMIYDVATFRANIKQTLTTIARMVASNSQGALTFKNDKDARDTLASLAAEPQVIAAALYDKDGNIFATYPTGTAPEVFPTLSAERQANFEAQRVVVFEPVEREGGRMGTLCLIADLHLFYRKLETYAVLCAIIMIGALSVAMFLSHRLQKTISEPVMALAETARIVSQRNDYSVRAPRLSGDELGLMTDAFNQMLVRIQEQTAALQENEERLRLALQSANTGTWDWNLVTNKLTWDAQLHRLFGREPGTFNNTYEAFTEAVHPQDHAMVEREIKSALDGHREFIAEFRSLWPDGSVHHLLSRGQGFYDANGKPIRMVGVTVDITERRLNEEASNFLASIVQSTDDAIIGKDVNGTVVSWNPGAERMFGYTAKEMIGQPIDLIVSPDRPDEESRILKAVRNGETHSYETVRIHKDGHPIHISLTVSPIRDADGKIVGASSISRDITERIRAQEALARHALMLSEQAQMLDLANVMARDIKDRIILWNTGMEKMYGWLREETLGHISHEVLKTQFPVPLETMREELFRYGHWEGELVHTRKDGQKLTVSSQWVLHKNEKGAPTAIIEVNTDITERKRAEQQMLRMNVELERRVQARTAELTAANQELEAFTYSVAHDLRAPLRHIDAFSKILAEDFSAALPPEGVRYLETIRRGSQNMSHLVDDLLNLARVGRQELKNEIVSLGDMVKEVIEEMDRETRGRKIEWHIAKLPKIAGDPGLLKQVFVNLISNALKYSRPRAKTVINIGLQEINGEATLYIRDNGVGFNMKYSDKLFGVFQRLHRAEEFEGTGVGLAIVERVIRRHGGRIWAESELDRGATFYVTLPGLEQGLPQAAHAETREMSG